jgi:TRAP-type mannitol/chloroaromatic compound transport system permease small subunit
MTPYDIGQPLGVFFTVMGFALAPFLLLPLLIVALGEAAARVARPAVDIVDRVSLAFEAIARWCLLVMAFGMLATVVLRYAFGESFTKLTEGVLYAHALGFLLAAPAALLRDAHVRVDIIYGSLGERGRAVVNLLGYALFAAPVLLMLLFAAGPVVDLAWRIGERSPETDGLPLVFLLKTAIPVFAASLLAQAMAQACRAAIAIRGLAPAAAPAEGLPQGEGVA